VRSWERASFQMNTRPPEGLGRGRMKRRDLLLPAYHDRLKLLGACAACGLAIGFLYVWLPATFVVIAMGTSIGPELWWIVLATALVSTAVLYVVAARKTEQYRAEVLEL
jgi:polyferredoxin